jgi:hypothetical protein
VLAITWSRIAQTCGSLQAVRRISPYVAFPFAVISNILSRHIKDTEGLLKRKFVFFMDDFGTRTTCKGVSNASSPAHEFSFALGGIIVASEDIDDLAKNVTAFCEKWDVPALHGNKIRSGKGKFGFLKNDTGKKAAFFSELDNLVLDERLTAHACVICRPGYRDRYLAKHPDSTRWAMSKTAFDISVERAAKFAMRGGRQLDVVYERTGAKEDRLLESYFADLKTAGMGFCVENSKQYGPLTGTQFTDHLNVIWPDGKANSLLQLADLVVHPVSHVTCGKKNRAYDQLVSRKLLLDFKHEDNAVGVKYSCFDGEYGAWKQLHKHTRDPEGSLEAVGVKPDPVA